MGYDCDVLVIGGGMAGLVAGITASQGNAKTLVVRKGEGATSMSSGAIDIAGYLRGASTPFLSPLEGISAFSQIYPYHPYALLSDMELNDDYAWFRDTISWFSNLLDGTPAAVTGGLDRTIMALTVLGTKKPTCLVQKTMYTQRLDNPDEVLLFAGIKGLPDFSSSAAAKSMTDHVISTGEGPRRIVHTDIECSPFQKTFNISPIELARYIETEEGFKHLATELTKQVQQTDTSLVAIPPILGLKDPFHIKEKLEKEIGAEIFELLSFPPSVPGHRLQRSLEGELRNAGGTLLLGHEAIGYECEESRTINITFQSPRRIFNIHPNTVILATGKFVGGGINGDAKGLKEGIFNIPVLDGEYSPVQNTRPRNLTQIVSVQATGHGLFECGIGVDSKFQPTDAAGAIFSSNLWSAGSVLGGYNYPTEKSGLGVALATGKVCGELALASVRGGK
ncbi:MAG: anaerobic glycerol-3-phosphate dehydrogenase subunit GlpB [Candidatus Thorarchaeota archaeon]